MKMETLIRNAHFVIPACRKPGPTLLSLLSILLSLTLPVQAAFEREQLSIEREMKVRIEDVLSKTLPLNSYLVNVKVDMEAKSTGGTVRTNRRSQTGNNPFLAQNRFVLPGVPVKKELTVNQDTISEDIQSSQEPQAQVKRILVSIMVSPDVAADRISALQDLVTANIPFNPLRGDEIDIQSSALLKSTGSDASVDSAPANPFTQSAPTSSSPSLWFTRISWPVVSITAVTLAILVLFLVFLFGPVRAFLNRLLAVLPRVGEQAAYSITNAPAKAPTNGSNGNSMYGHTNGNVKATDSMDMPFRFINEDTLAKLPILLRQMPANQTAVVLAYLSPEWAGRVLNGLDTASQMSVMNELSQAREIPSAVVKEIEAQVKAKLPYLVGGTDWIQSVYQLTEPQTQRALLGSLTQQSPELADTLRRKSFFYEDLGAISPAALRAVIQDAGYPTVAAALRDERPDVRTALLGRLPPATREILEQEIEAAPTDPGAGVDAKARIALSGRKLLADGRIALPERA
jgi:hypothetical protein